MEPIKLVARFRDGKIQKGFCKDFAPNKPEFHLLGIESGPGEQGEKVFLQDLKALFFVKDFEGIPARQDDKDFSGAPPLSGRKVEVMFTDGEKLVGTTTGYDPQRPGFFLFPADPQSNNIRIFVVTSAVKNVQFV